jgi:hypothetical protein
VLTGEALVGLLKAAGYIADSPRRGEAGPEGGRVAGPAQSLVDDPLLSEYERGLAEGRRLQHEADVAALRDEGERRGNPAASLLWTAELLASHGPTDGSSE